MRKSSLTRCYWLIPWKSQYYKELGTTSDFKYNSILKLYFRTSLFYANLCLWFDAIARDIFPSSLRIMESISSAKDPSSITVSICLIHASNKTNDTDINLVRWLIPYVDKASFRIILISWIDRWLIVSSLNITLVKWVIFTEQDWYGILYKGIF